MRLDRRTFLKLSAVGATAAATGTGRAQAAGRTTALPEAIGVLVDTTRCIGCRACEAACAEANGLDGPEDGDDVLARRRHTGPDTLTVVNRTADANGRGERFVKTQCLHCVEPACATACPTAALEKLPSGPVVYHPERCLGCRYCMLSCPFDMPKYEYHSPTPRVRKCSFCADRRAQGLEPACTSVCPTGAIEFGPREALLLEARRRVYGQPDRYVPVIYGEHEAGGTSWLYIGDRTPADLGLKTDVPATPYSGLAQGALAAVPVVITLWPPLLMGLYAFSRRREAASASVAPEPEEQDHA